MLFFFLAKKLPILLLSNFKLFMFSQTCQYAIPLSSKEFSKYRNARARPKFKWKSSNPRTHRVRKKMAHAARLNLRMQKELKLLLTDPPHGVSFSSLSDDSSSPSSSLTSINARMPIRFIILHLPYLCIIVCVDLFLSYWKF